MIRYFLESIVLFALISVIPSASFAQKTDTTGNLNPQNVARVETDFMKHQLALDSTKAAAVYEINLKYAKENQQVMKSDKSDSLKLMQIRKNSDAKDNELKRVLTNDQYNKYIAMKKEMMNSIKEKMKQKQ
jgi:hypothetical protein